MTSKSRFTPKLVEEIKADLQSPSTTTSQTLQLLCALLGHESGEWNKQLPAAGPSQTSAVPIKSRGKITGAPRRPPAKRNSAIAIHEDLPSAIPSVDAKARRGLATQVFNTALKTLTSAAKIRYQQRSASPKCQSKLPDRQPASPLKECSPNRQSKPDRLKSCSRDEKELGTTAECAALALHCLRQLETEGNGVDAPDCRLEQGALVLLDKTITLELASQAVQQLRTLYEQYWKRRKVTDTALIQSQKDAAAYLPIAVAFETEGPAFKFATSLQSHGLRLAILTGPTCVTESFVNSVAFEAPGSPASIIIEGNKAGHLDDEACGMQLRTISLALSKLCASSFEKRALTGSYPACILSLASAALRIKAVSWKYLGHQPELQKELWMPMRRHLQRYSTTAKTSDAGALAQICVKSLQETLSTLGMNAQAPSDLKVAGDSTFQETDKGNFGVGDCIGQLHPILDAVAGCIDTFPGQNEALDRCLGQLRDTMDRQTSLSRKDLTDVFLKTARIRKSLLGLSISIEQEAITGKAKTSSLQLQIGCVRTLYCFVSFVLRCLRRSGSSEKPIPQKPAAPEDNLLLTYAKTVEAVLSADELSVTHSAILSEEAKIVLYRSLEISALVESGHWVPTTSNSTRAFFAGIPVRISQAFWTRFLWLTENRGSIHDRIRALEVSIDVLQKRSLDERQAGVISLKYDNLARLLEETESYAKALEVLQKALDTGIELGLLNDAVETFVSDTSERMWEDSKSRFYMFGIHLVSCARLSLKSSETSPTTLMVFDRDHLPPLHRAVMMEHQLASLLKSSSNMKKEQLKAAVQYAQRLLRGSNHPLYQLRLVSRLLFLLERSKLWNAKDFFTHEEIRCMTAVDTTEQKLSHPASLLIHTLSVQWALATGQLDEDLLKALVSNLKQDFTRIAESRATWNAICSAQVLSSQLVALAGFAGVLGNDRVQLDVLMMLRMMHQRISAVDLNQQITCLIQTGKLQNRLDNTVLAGKSFAESEKLLSLSVPRSQNHVFWALGYAEYLFNIMSPAKSADFIHKAREQQVTVLDEALCSSHHRLERDVAMCDAAYLSSKMAFHRGYLGQAILYARQAVRLSTSLWMSIEKKLQASHNSHEDSSMQILTEGLSNMTLCSDQPNLQPLQGAKFWSSISLHRQILRHISSLFSHLGLYQDSLYYSQQASKIARITSGRSFQNTSSLDLALLQAQAGQITTIQQMLAVTSAIRRTQDLSVEQMSGLLSEAEAYIFIGAQEDAGKCLQLMDGLQVPWLRKCSSRSATPELPCHVTPKNKVNKPVRVKRSKQATRQALPEPPARQTQPTFALTMFQSEVKCRLVVLNNNLHGVQPRAGEGVERPLLDPTLSPDPSVTVSGALSLLRSALEYFASDPTNSALAETALAMPVRYRPKRKSGQMSVLLEELSISTPRKGKTIKAPNRIAGVAKMNVPTANGPDLLTKAFELLRSINDNQHHLLSSPIINQMFKALSQITLISSALRVPLNYSPLTVVLQSLISKEIARSRERYTIEAEKLTSSLEQVRQWPQLSTQAERLATETFKTELKELLYALPQSWTIISIGLSHDKKELLVSKIEAGSSPFLLRVPLGRPHIEEDEPHEFTFDFAKAELIDIMQQADASSHDDRGQGDKHARSSWYTEREALDARLKSLLVNIENIWLGGFRGLLASQSNDAALLSRFGQSLSQSLDKNLPSRQKASKSTTRVELHAHVLELFLSLPFNNESELEDSVTDLLYFVIDILQFNEEPNAYDEIDFDAILVDVLDALRAYHAFSSSSAGLPLTRHTILILDKELEAFPWESLPCLQRRPVSRMPSLSAIKQRLDLMHAQSATADALSITADQGAYILNPSSDLVSTQQTFESTFLTHLTSPGWTSLINTPPAESHFSSYLQDHPLLLYFGHGSGAQYILKRHIRAMQKCAVTWLMGCSSAKMVECGDFESYGMPNVYVHGGSPAVVGTLWDVTDRDLDRFAMRGLSLWGLVEAPDEDDESARGKGRGKRAGKGRAKTEEAGSEEQWEKWKGTTKEERRGKIALDEAVCAGREACRLRYLNGAAVVVYGVPVVLE